MIFAHVGPLLARLSFFKVVFKKQIKRYSLFYKLDGINTENPENAVVITQLLICGCQ